MRTRSAVSLLLLLHFWCPGALGAEPTDRLASCIRANLSSESAKETAQTQCKPHLSRWWRSCLQLPDNRCAERLDELYSEMDRQHGEQPEIQHTPASLAARFRAGLPLPGLPNLHKPVRLRAESLVCRSPGALRNPNVMITVQIGACELTSDEVRVLVHEPTTAESYIQSGYYGIVLVSWEPPAMSSARRGRGWVSLNRLRN